MYEIQVFAKEDMAISMLETAGDSRRKELAKDLGFLRQAEASDESGISVVGKVYPMLSRRESIIWRLYLPTRYSNKNADWENYSFDVIPVPALEQIRVAQETGFFSSIEIWTPERVHQDPLAVGIVDAGPVRGEFLIARWGECLKPFDEIEREVATSRGTSDTRIFDWLDRVVRGPVDGFSCTTPFFGRHCGQKMLRVFAREDRRHYHRKVCLNCMHEKSLSCNCYSGLMP